MKRSYYMRGAAVLLLVAGGAGAFWFKRHTSSDTFWETETRVTQADKARAATQLNGGLATNAMATVAAIPAGQKVRLAVGGLGLSEAGSRELGDVLTVELGKEPGFELVDRQSLDRVLAEQQVSLAGLVRARDAVRVGQLLRADWFLLGSTVVAGGGTSVVARVVDARTGVMRDVGIFDGGKGALGLSAQLAGFVRGTRRGAGETRPAVYLAAGTFEDLSLNDRRADLPAQLRAGLAQLSQGLGVTLVERECVSVLLNEVRLDLAGLIAESDASVPVRMQPAFWLIDGYYQSFETTTLDVELVLNVQRIFGGRRTFTLRAAPGAALLGKVRSTVSPVIQRPDEVVMLPSRKSEIRAQLMAGRELSGAELLEGLVFPRSEWSGGPEDVRRRRNDAEAIRSFQTVLLLSPGHREARVWMAACLQSGVTSRPEEARVLCEELIEEGGDDQWGKAAHKLLELSFSPRDPQAAPWFEAAAQRTKLTGAAEVYRQQAVRARRELETRSGAAAANLAAQLRAEERLFTTFRARRDLPKGRQWDGDATSGMLPFVEAYGTNAAAAAQRLVDLYPQMKAEWPAFAPQTLVFILSHQVTTNTPVLAEVESLLDQLDAAPGKAPRNAAFWSDVSDLAWEWARQHKDFALAARLLEMQWRDTGRVGLLQEITLAYTYMDLNRWEKALEIFGRFEGEPIMLWKWGPWGDIEAPVLPAKEAARCRRELGLAPSHDPREFDIGRSAGRTEVRATMEAGVDGFWVGFGGKLMHLGFDAKKTTGVSLPLAPRAGITALSVTASNIWIGTMEDGLFEYELQTKALRRIGIEEGLLMNSVAELERDGDRLWIGYGEKWKGYGSSRNPGGLSYLDLRTHKVVSFSRPLGDVEAGGRVSGAIGPSTVGPPVTIIRALACGPAGQVWFFTENAPLQRYSSATQAWERFPQVTRGAALAVQDGLLFVGGGSKDEGKPGTSKGWLGVSILRLEPEEWRNVGAVKGLPAHQVTALTPAGQVLWVGGLGYVARVDLRTCDVTAFAYVPASTVDRILVAGGYLWVTGGGELYGVRLGRLP